MDIEPNPFQKRQYSPFWELMSDSQKADYLARGRPVKDHESTLAIFRTDAVLVRSYKPVCAGMVTESAAIGSKPSRRSISNLIFKLNNSDEPMLTMLTFTMTPECNDAASVDQHREIFKRALQHLRDKHEKSEYVWVREFQDNESIHWHIFAGFRCEPDDGDIDTVLTRHWSRWFAKQYFRLFPHLDYGFMREGNGSDFYGCVRVELLRTEAAGRYAGKEGGKRLQKEPPEKWRVGGGAWWRNSKGVKCTELRRVKVNVTEVDSARLIIDGKPIEVPYRVQFNASKKFCKKDSEDYSD